MSRFRGAARASQPKNSYPEDEADVVTSKSPPPHVLDDLLDDCGILPECHVEVAHSTVTNWGARHENEDRWMAWCSTEHEKNTVPYWILGVLDGHDTEVASDNVSRLLPLAVAKHLRAGTSVIESYTRALAECEEGLKKLNTTAGTCVLSCLVAGRSIWCSNLGDCRAVLITLQGETPKVTGVHWLSRDQKASTDEERKRIREAGGVVIDGRVEGLEPSRTLGDFDVKMSTKEGVISIVPEVRRFQLTDGTTPAQAIFMCATDGVWDVITGNDICNLIHSRKELANLQEVIGRSKKPNCQPLKDLADDLVQFSVARGSQDDCTAVVALISVPLIGS